MCNNKENEIEIEKLFGEKRTAVIKWAINVLSITAIGKVVTLLLDSFQRIDVMLLRGANLKIIKNNYSFLLKNAC